MRCIGCGQEIPDGSPFCAYCGTQQPQQPAQQVVQQPAQQSAPQQSAPQQPAPQPQYQPQQPAAPQGGGKKGLLIAGICIGVAILIVGIVIVFLLLKKDDDDDKGKKAEETTEAVTEASSEETTTEATTEATTEEPAPTPYAEEHGITFANIGDVASGNNFSGFTFEANEDELNDEIEDDDTVYYEVDGVSVETETYSSYVNEVLVSEPDAAGNVIYTVEVKETEETEMTNESGKTINHTCYSWRPRVFDYYSGSFIDDGGVKEGLAGDDLASVTNLEFDGKQTAVKTVYRFEWLNVVDESEEVGNALKSHFKNETKYIYSFKVPQNYDGLVFVLYNGDVDADEYKAVLDMDDSSKRYKDSSDNMIKYFDEDAIGYVKDPNNGLFIRLSDVAHPTTAEAVSSVYSVIDYSDPEYFDWTEDVKGGNYSLGGETITDPAELNGWWEGYMVWDPDNAMDSYGEELVNVKLESNGSSIDWTDDYFAMKWGEDGSWDVKTDEDTTITGTFNSDGTLTFDAATIGMNFEMYGFYTNGYCQYAVGWLTAQSGESAWVFLYRP